MGSRIKETMPRHTSSCDFHTSKKQNPVFDCAISRSAESQQDPGGSCCSQDDIAGTQGRTRSCLGRRGSFRGLFTPCLWDLGSPDHWAATDGSPFRVPEMAVQNLSMPGLFHRGWLITHTACASPHLTCLLAWYTIEHLLSSSGCRSRRLARDAYMRTNKQTNKQTNCIHTYIDTCIHTYIHRYIHRYIHTCKCICICIFIGIGTCIRISAGIGECIGIGLGIGIGICFTYIHIYKY